MQVSLTHKFVVGSLVVGGAVIGLPVLLAETGIDVAPWIAPFVTLGAGGVVGFFLSRELTHTFQNLSRATDLISRGDLAAVVEIVPSPRFPDETHGLALGIERMAARLREVVEHVQATADRVSSAAHELTLSAEHVSSHNAGISSNVSALASSVVEEQRLLSETNRQIHEIAS